MTLGGPALKSGPALATAANTSRREALTPCVSSSDSLHVVQVAVLCLCRWMWDAAGMKGGTGPSESLQKEHLGRFPISPWGDLAFGRTGTAKAFIQ